MKVRIVSIFFLVLLAVLAIPVAAVPLPAGHNMTFINTCSQDIWINLQGGPKGECDHDVDAIGAPMNCSACSFCPSGSMCNTSKTTGNNTPLCCPGTKKDRNLCWGGQGCVKGNCCPGIPQSHNLDYPCPESGAAATSCSEHNLTIAQINALTGYNNPVNHIQRTVCNGSLISNGGFKLNASGGTRRFTFDHGWQGALYPRTGCQFNEAGTGNCTTGNCVDNLGTSVLECGGAGSAAPVTKTEFNFDSPDDWYDVSWVDGFNVAMVVEPTSFDETHVTSDPAHTCKAGGCSVGFANFFSPQVPDWNVLKYPSASNFAGILSDCNYYTNLMDSKVIPTNNATNATKYGYCCPVSEGYVNNSDLSCVGAPAGKCRTCAGQDNSLFPFNQTGALPNSAKLFYHTCPSAYAYTYNDTDALMQCWGNTTVQTGYKITISCPMLVPTLTQAPVPPHLGSPLSSGDEQASGAQIAPASPKGALTFIFNDFTQSGGSSTTSDFTIHHIHVNTTGTTGDTVLRVIRSPALGMVPELDGHSFAIYYLIESPDLDPSQITSALVEFSVSERTLSTLGLTPADVVLMHYDGKQWVQLPTVYDYSVNGRAYFSAVTPGFSYFAVTSRSGSAVSVSGTTLPLITQPSQNRQPEIAAAPSPGLTTATLAAAIPRAAIEEPAGEQNLSSATPQAGAPALPQVAGVVVAAICVIGVGWYARRWWIRRQNPALFQDMD